MFLKDTFRLKSAADMGKVMGAATKELAGKADGREISVKVKQLLLFNE
jgi:uncharacterized protein YqeY